MPGMASAPGGQVTIISGQCSMGLSNSKDPVKDFIPKKIKRKNMCILHGWMGLFFLEQIENLLQISPVPHRSHFFISLG